MTTSKSHELGLLGFDNDAFSEEFNDTVALALVDFRRG